MQLDLNLDKLFYKIDENELRPKIRSLYNKYKDKFDFTFLDLRPDDKKINYYVYEWFQKDTDKVFYVGKGIGSRINHIRKEMDSCTIPYKPQCKREPPIFKEINNNGGIDCRFVLKELSQIEASIFEICWIWESISQNEVLIQYQNVPAGYLYDDFLPKISQEIYESRNFEPCILKERWQGRYLNLPTVTYDVVNPQNLKKVCLHFDGLPNPYIIYDKEQKIYKEQLKIYKYLNFIKGKTSKNPGKTTNAVIEFGNITYDNYIQSKNLGCAVYHIFDVLEFLKDNDITNDINIPVPTIKLPKIDIELQNILIPFLKSVKENLSANITTNTDIESLLHIGIDCYINMDYKQAIKCLETAILCTPPNINIANNCATLGKIYHIAGMYDEEIRVLDKAIAILKGTTAENHIQHIIVSDLKRYIEARNLAYALYMNIPFSNDTN